MHHICKILRAKLGMLFPKKVFNRFKYLLLLGGNQKIGLESVRFL